MDYVVVDLEMCRIAETNETVKLKGGMEIIQIGAVLLNEKYQEYSSFCVYVNPEYGVIDPFIEELTGIHNRDIKDAPSLCEALSMMQGWIGDRDVTFIAWSRSDYLQFKREIDSKKIDSAFAKLLLNKKKWRDLQKEFKRRFSLTRDYSLSDALAIMDIEPDGHAHNGLMDSKNTGKIARKMKEEPDYEFPEAFRDAIDIAPPERLMYTVSDLFAGIRLDTLIEVTA